MRIVIAGRNYPASGRILSELLPEDEIIHSPKKDLLEKCQNAQVLIPTMTLIDRDLIMATNLKLIQQWGVGLEGVDMLAATEKKVAVCNVPADIAIANAQSTAEQAVFLMMALARKFKQAQKNLLQGPWGDPQGVALFGQKALIVGLGRVGKALARKLSALGMEVMAVKNNLDKSLIAEYGLSRLVGPNEIKQVLPQADFVISSLTATPETMEMFNRDLFSHMKPQAYFVNVGRGKVVKEDDLVSALDENLLQGAGLDVFFQEPATADNPLLTHEKVVAMPHIGGNTIQSFNQIGENVAENIRRLKKGEKFLYQANPF